LTGKTSIVAETDSNMPVIVSLELATLTMWLLLVAITLTRKRNLTPVPDAAGSVTVAASRRVEKDRPAAMIGCRERFGGEPAAVTPAHAETVS
jgi:hypothetical protein